MSRSTEFAAWLATQLRTRRISQRQLAERSGVAHSTVSRILAGGRVPSLATANRLARALGHESVHAIETATDAVARVERALRMDRMLDGRATRRVMDLYLSLRRGPGGQHAPKAAMTGPHDRTVTVRQVHPPERQPDGSGSGRLPG